MSNVLTRWLDSDVGYSFRTSPTAIVAAAIAFVCVFCSIFAGWVSPHNPFDLASLELSDARLPPAWQEGGRLTYLLGTDDQGRDILSALIYGARISLVVGIVSVILSVLAGVALGLVAGFKGGWIDTFLMRVCDVMLSFPAILVALLIAGVGRAMLPNVTGPVLVLATIQVATAIITEATLSFLGVGVPPTSPSLGTLIRVGNDYLFSGEWWITIFPGVMLVLIALSVNLLGDWLRDALNPRLR